MARQGGAPENLKPPWSSTNQPKNKNGRKPSSIKKYIKDNNVCSADVSAMAKYILPLKQADLTKMLKDDKVPFVMRLFANAVLKDLKNGNVQNVMTLIDRAVGKPQEKHELTGAEGGPILTRDDRQHMIDALLVKRDESEA